jgi:WD40 repeat protein
MSVVPDDHSIAIAEFSSIGIWDLKGKRQTLQLGLPATRLTFSPNGSMLGFASYGEPLRIWETSEARVVRSLKAQTWIRALAFSPDDRFLVSGDNDVDNGSRLMVWDVTTGALRAMARSDLWPSLELVDASARYLGKPLQDGDAKERALQTAQEGLEIWNCLCLAISPSGGILASAGTETAEPQPCKSVIRLWSFPNLSEWRVLNGHVGYIAALSFTDDGGVLASASDDGTIILWDVERGKPLFTLNGHSDSVRAVSFALGGNLLASGSDDGTVRVWDVISGEAARVLKGHAGSVAKVAFQPDGTIVSAGHDGIVIIWSAAT